MGGFLTALPVAGGIIKSIWGDTAAREAADAANDVAAQGEFAAEFGTGNNRTCWDSLINGLNRLPRPVTIGAIIYVVFIWPARDMAGFLDYTQAISVVPEGFWYLATIAVSFYFGGRMQATAKSFRMTTDQQTMAARLAAQQTVTKSSAITGAEVLDDAAFAAALADPVPLSNEAIEEWNRRRQEGR